MLEKLQRRMDTQTINIVLLCLLTFIDCLKCLIILVFIFSFIPVDPGPIFHTIYPNLRDVLHPERDLFFYRIFVIVNVIIQGLMLYFFRGRLADKDFTKKLIPFFAAESFWLLLQCFAVFKILLFKNPVWPNLFYITLALPIFSKLYWPEVKIWSMKAYQYLHKSFSERTSRIWDIGLVILIVALIFPNVEAVLARIFLNDSFRHFDSFLTAPGWAILSGLKLNVDILSQYSVVLPRIFAGLTQLLGGFNYPNLMTVLVILSITYFILCYGFLRFWLKSVLISSIGILWAIKLQMFQLGAWPLIWQFPSATVVRSFLDLFILFFLLKHILTFRRLFLLLAGLFCGIALSFMLDTGIYITLAFYAYLFLLIVIPPLRKENFTHPRDIGNVFGLFILPIVTFLFILWLIQGSVVFTKIYWSQANEFMNLFLQGWGALPVYFGLREKNFFAFFTGLTIPVIYVWTMLTVGTLVFLQKINRSNLIAVILSVYGLGLYHYFICRSAVTSYYTVAIPLVLILCFWLQKISGGFSVTARRNVLALIFFLSFGALITNSLFMIYPNVFNLYRDNWKKEKAFYKENSVFQKDTALIQKFTSVEDRVPVFSSFEAKFLVEAKRKPFFFYFPLIESRQLKTNEFGGTYMFTKARMEKVMNQLETEKPEYVFVEKKLFKGLIPAQYFNHYETLRIMVQYFHKYYEVEEEGEYLIALKRKS